MTEQEAIKYLEQHAYIDDAVKDMCIKAMKKQISKEISVAPIKAHAEPTKMRTVIQTDKETTFDDVQEILNGTDLLAEHFRVNDVFYIPVKNQEEAIPFEVVHVAEDTRSIYLMSRDILTRKAMSEVADWLDIAWLSSYIYENKLNELRPVGKDKVSTKPGIPQGICYLK